MAKIALLSNLATNISAHDLDAGQTLYRVVGSGYTYPATWTTESTAQIKYHHAGTFSNLSVNVQSNTLNVSATIRLRINGSNGNQVLTVGSGATGVFEDSSNTDTISANDLVSLSMVAAAGTGSMRPIMASVHYEVTSYAVSKMVMQTSTFSLSSSASPYYYGLPELIFTDASLATEATRKYTAQCAFTAKNLTVYIGANTRLTSTAFVIRKNGGDGNQTLTVGSGATGRFEDTSNTDSYSIGDTLAVKFTLTVGTGSLSPYHAAIDLVSSGGDAVYYGGSDFSSQSAGTTLYYSPIIGAYNSNSSAAGLRAYPQIGFDAERFSCHVAANTLSAGTTLSFMVNGSAVNQTLSIGAGATGLFEDTTHTDTIVDGDGISFKSVCAAGSGAITFAHMAFVGAYGADGTTYEDNYTETVTVSDSLGVAATFAAPFTDAATPADSLSNIMTMANALSESVTPADSVTGDNTWTTFDDGVSASTGATITGLTNSTLYEVRVFAVNNGGLSDASNVEEVTPTA